MLDQLLDFMKSDDVKNVDIVVEFLISKMYTHPDIQNTFWNITKSQDRFENGMKDIHYYVPTGNDRFTHIKNIVKGSVYDKLIYYTLPPGKYRVRITKEFDWDRLKYGDSASCFWQSHSGAKAMLRSNGGLGVTIDFSSESDAADSCRFRVWLARHDDYFVIFNCYKSNYGPLRVSDVFPSPAAVLGHLIYKCAAVASIELYNNGSTTKELYINANTGWIIGSFDQKDKLKKISSIDLRWNEIPSRTCAGCRVFFPITEMVDTQIEDHIYCSSCAEEHVDLCSLTMELYPKTHLKVGLDGNKINMYDWEKLYFQCPLSDTICVRSEGKTFTLPSGREVLVSGERAVDFSKIVSKMSKIRGGVLSYGVIHTDY